MQQEEYRWCCVLVWRVKSSQFNLMLNYILLPFQTGNKLHLFRLTVQTSDNNPSIYESLILQNVTALGWRNNKS